MVYTLVCSRDTTLPKTDERAFYRYINKGIFIAKVFRADSFQINLHISCFELIRLQPLPSESSSSSCSGIKGPIPC